MTANELIELANNPLMIYYSGVGMVLIVIFWLSSKILEPKISAEDNKGKATTIGMWLWLLLPGLTAALFSPFEPLLALGAVVELPWFLLQISFLGNYVGLGDK